MKPARRFGVVIAVTGSLLLPEPGHAAGLFEELGRALFGHQPPPPVYEIVPDPLNVTVRPARRPKPRKHVASKPAPPVVRLNPETDPYWYLNDPTLRAGDIVVTRSNVLVFEGTAGKSHQMSDFTSLGRSSAVSKTTRQRAMAVLANRPPPPEPDQPTLAARESGN